MNFEVSRPNKKISLFKVYIDLLDHKNKLKAINWKLENKLGKELSHKLTIQKDISNFGSNYLMKSRLELDNYQLINFGFDFKNLNETMSSQTYLDYGHIEKEDNLTRLLRNDFELTTKSSRFNNK